VPRTGRRRRQADALWWNVSEDKILKDHIVCDLTIADADNPAEIALDHHHVPELKLR
jgi:hypothetical protein